VRDVIIRRFDASDEHRAFEKGYYVGMVISGRNRIKMRDGREYDLTAGDVFYVAPGHDSWVVGDEPYVSIHLAGAASYAEAKVTR
jgi:mannose-6-phosphate isomerase-like protein (cupin superfamily)